MQELEPSRGGSTSLSQPPSGPAAPLPWSVVTRPFLSGHRKSDWGDSCAMQQIPLAEATNLWQIAATCTDRAGGCKKPAETRRRSPMDAAGLLQFLTRACD